MARRPIRVAIRAAYPAILAGLRSLLTDAGFEVTDEQEGRLPDIIVADIASDEREERPDQRIPTVYLADSRTVALGAGAEGWLPRDVNAAELAATVRAVAAGMIVLHPSFAWRRDGGGTDVSEAHEGLTPRELEVLLLLAAGRTNKAIAFDLGISEHTVKFHVGAVLAKLDVSSRTEAVTVAARRGLLIL